MKWSDDMANASQDHVTDIGPKGLVQHDSANGRMGVKERIRKYGNLISCYGENLSFHCEDAIEVML